MVDSCDAKLQLPSKMAELTKAQWDSGGVENGKVGSYKFTPSTNKPKAKPAERVASLTPLLANFTKVDRQIEGLLKSAEKREDSIPALQHALENREALQILAPNMETLMSHNLNSSKGLYRDYTGEHYKGYYGGC